MKGADIHGGTAEAKGGKERFHDYRGAGDDETADDGKLPSVGVTAPNGEAAADDADSPEDEAEEHYDTHRAARALGEPSGGLGEDRNELWKKKYSFH